MPAVVNAFTVDLEDWYQGIEVEAGRWGEFENRVWIGCQRLLDLLDGAGVKATFFALADIGERFPDLIRMITARGHEIGTHGVSHTFIYRQSPIQFKQEMIQSMEVLGNLSGAQVVSHRAPFFSITKQSLWALDILAEVGIRYDSSVFPVHNYRYGIPDASRTPWRHRTASGASLVEFPVSTVRILRQNIPASGGAYFRIYPYALSRWLFKRVNQSGWPFVFYIHPWELDPAQPRLPLPWRIRATHYHNLARTEDRIRWLLEDFPFNTFQQVVQGLEQNGVIASAEMASQKALVGSAEQK